MARTKLQKLVQIILLFDIRIDFMFTVEEMKSRSSKTFTNIQSLETNGSRYFITVMQQVMLLLELCYPMKKKVQQLCLTMLHS